MLMQILLVFDRREITRFLIVVLAFAVMFSLSFEFESTKFQENLKAIN